MAVRTPGPGPIKVDTKIGPRGTHVTCTRSHATALWRRNIRCFGVRRDAPVPPDPIDWKGRIKKMFLCSLKYCRMTTRKGDYSRLASKLQTIRKQSTA